MAAKAVFQLGRPEAAQPLVTPLALARPMTPA